MIHRKLLEVLKLLSTSERTKLRLYLRSPYFNYRSNAEEVLQLFDHIIEHHAEEQHPNLAKSVVAGLFFPQRPFVEGQKGPVDALASDLFSLVKRFLAQLTFEQKDPEFSEGLVMAKFYRRFGMEERFVQAIQSLRKTQDSSPFRDGLFFQKQYALEEEAASFESLNNSFEDDANLSAAAQNLDIAYVINKLELMSLLVYQQKLSQHVHFDANALLAQAAIQLPEDYPKVGLYELNRLAFKLIQQPDDDEAFESYEHLLKLHKSEIPFEKVRNLKAYYRFFWNRRYFKSGDASVRIQMFQVYKEHYEEGYFYEGEDIMINSLKVLVLFGLKLNQFEWVKLVLDEHPPARICGTKHPIEAHSLCLAEYYFYLKDYATAADTLVYKHFENPNYSLWAEMLLIKVYFETEDELLDYRMKALDQKVRRTKLSTEAKSRYYRFLQKLDKIVKYSTAKSSPKRMRLIEEIKTTPGILEREWLLEKLGTEN